jgi:hypothetical protein
MRHGALRPVPAFFLTKIALFAEVRIDTTRPVPLRERPHAQVAELVDALVSGTSGESRGGSSPLLGTIRL